MAFLSSDQIERRAQEARRKFSIDQQVVPDVVTLIFKLKKLGLINDYERVSDADMGNDEAVHDPYERRLKVRESVFVAANQNKPRARFTIAHELGHILLGHSRIRHRRADYDRAEAASTVRSDEQQANMFAAAFLMPFDLSAMRQDTSAEELAAHFHVSRSVAMIRLPELQRQYRIVNRIPRPLPKSVQDFLAGVRKT